MQNRMSRISLPIHDDDPNSHDGASCCGGGVITKVVPPKDDDDHNDDADSDSVLVVVGSSSSSHDDHYQRRRRLYQELWDADVAERQANESPPYDNSNNNNEEEEEEPEHDLDTTTTTTTTTTTATTAATNTLEPPQQPQQPRMVLNYTVQFLNHQLYYDDLKHIDYQYIDYGLLLLMGNHHRMGCNAVDNDDVCHRNRNGSKSNNRPLIIEQEKTLGKGGFCWDAAFILADYIVTAVGTAADTTTATMMELGCGTGLCGMYIAKALQQQLLPSHHHNNNNNNNNHTVATHLTITDLAGPIQSLIQRNLQRNFDPDFEYDASVWYHYFRDHQYPWQQHHPQHLTKGTTTTTDDDTGRNTNNTTTAIPTTTFTTIEAAVLDWDDHPAVRNDDDSSVLDDGVITYDIVFGADVVSTLYDPINLARTIHRLCHGQSTVYISYKERLSTIHDQFHTIMNELFHHVDIISTSTVSRNRNPDVYIMTAQQKRNGVAI
jgi:hypothetical protein